jgi:hypothetical protein
MTPIDKIRAALEGSATHEIQCGFRARVENARAALAELEPELVELRAFKAAIDATPTVAWLCHDAEGTRNDATACELSRRVYELSGRRVDPLIVRPEAK